MKREGCIVTRESRRPSDAGSVESESVASMTSQCWSVSTAATLTLSKDEEMEARKLEAQLCRIGSLAERKASGEFLTSWEKSEIRRKPEIDYAPVLVKVKNGAARWTLDTEPLSKDEEQQVRSAEERLLAIKHLQDRKDCGEWLERSEMAELKCKLAIESSPVMMRVREGAPRPFRDTAVASEPAPAQAPVPKTSPAPAPARVPVSKASPAPAPACGPVPKSSLAPLPVAPSPAPLPMGPSPASLPVATPAASPASPASSTHAEQDHAVSSAETSTKAQVPTLKDIVATIREELELEESLTIAQVIAEANRQLAMPATGTLAQQARSLFRELTSV